MATTDVGLHDAAGRAARVPVVNNMSIQVATVNGSGSQSISPTALFLIPLSFRVGFSPRGICICGNGELLKLYGTDWMLVTRGMVRGYRLGTMCPDFVPELAPPKRLSFRTA